MIAAQEDDHKPEYLYRNALALAETMGGNYGRTVGIPNTGHSVHAERPRLLSDLIMDFINEVPPSAVVACAL